jgi:Bacterial Ig-like domain (group 3)/FG-GAP-like repeat
MGPLLPHPFYIPQNRLQCPLAQAEADLNGDGVPDLIAVGPDSILSALANSKGTFTYQAALAYTAYSVRYIEPVSADFNGDGRQDVVFVGWDGTAAVALSNGDGTLKTPVNVITPNVALSCDLSYAAVGDVNGDKNLDLLFAYSGDSSCGQGTAVPSGYFVALGNGDGSFKTPVFYPLGSSVYSLALGYFHGKSNPLDLVINDQGVALKNANVSILQGKGDGTFGSSAVVNSDYGISQVLTDDFNQDGNADLTLIAYANDTTLGPGVNLLYAGNGDGTFANPATIDPGFAGISGAGLTGVYADVNGDGIPDLITTSLDTGLSVNLGTGKGAFAAPINYFFEADGNPVFAGNFLGDNTQSILSFSSYGGGTAFFMNQGGTSLTLSASPSNATSGQTITLTAALNATLAGRPAPSGTVTFYDGSTQIGSASAGSPQITTAQLSVGSHSIIAVYSGDLNFNPNTSAPITVTVTALPPDFSLTASATTLSVTNGQSASLTMTVAANATLTSSVTFQCAGLPAEATCVFSPASLSVQAGSSGTATITIAAKAASSNAILKAQIHNVTAFGGIAMAGLLFMIYPRNRAGWMLAMIGGLAIAAAAGLTGCGGSRSSSIGPTTPSDPGTPTGTANVTITATAVAGSTTIQHSVVVAVNVQ